MKDKRTFGGKDDFKFWADKPIQKGHAELNVRDKIRSICFERKTTTIEILVQIPKISLAVLTKVLDKMVEQKDLFVYREGSATSYRTAHKIMI